MPNSKNKQEIIFPEEVSENILKMLERYELEESLKEIEEKLYRGKLSPGGIIAETVWKIVDEKIKIKDLPSTLQKKLNISEGKAIQLAKDMKKEILDLVEKVPEEIPSPPLQKPKKEKPSPLKEDTYREPIE